MTTSADIALIISAQRLESYLRARGFQQDQALALYAWNMKVSAAFLPLIGALEITLRNLIRVRLEAVFGSNWWQNAEFVGLGGRQSADILRRAANDLGRRGHAVDSGRMTAELSLGYWHKMLLTRYEAALFTPMTTTFPDLPVGIDRASVEARVGPVCELRNRISHHEPIFRRNLSQDHTDALTLLGWLSPAKAAWIRPHSDVMMLLRRKP